jgi:hypothetical protein
MDPNLRETRCLRYGFEYSQHSSWSFIMTKSSLARRTLMLAVLSCGLCPISRGQSSTPALSLEDVVKDWRSGIPQELIITKIRKNGKPFSLSGAEIRALTDSGIPLDVVKYLMDPGLPPPTAPPAGSPPAPNQPAANAPVVRTRDYPADAQASRVPPEPGLYRFAGDTRIKTEIKILLGESQGAGLGKFVLQKGKAIGYLLGPTATTQISELTPVFYLRLPEGKPIEEVVLLALSSTKQRREIEIGQSLEKQELKSESRRPFEPVEVGPQLFRITPSKLARGEYVFLLLGSAEPPKGSYGKVYDFSIQTPRK